MVSQSASPKRAGVAALLALASACSARAHTQTHTHTRTATDTQSQPQPQAQPRVSHLIVVLFENRAFDHALGWLKRNDSRIDGLTGSEWNPIDPLNATSPRVYVTDRATDVEPDPSHEVEDMADQIFGTYTRACDNTTAETMNGYIANAAKHLGAAWAPHVMDGFAPQDVPVMSTLALEFGLSDNFFCAVPGPTYINRLYALSATSASYGKNDVMRTILGWPQQNIFTALTAANVSWGVYFEEAATAWLFNSTRTEAMLEHFHGMSDFYAHSAAGTLPSFVFLDPAYASIPGLVNASDQHPGHSMADGEAVMKQVYESLRASPLWNSSALIITYDESGGLPDHVPPPVNVPNPDGMPCSDCPMPFDFTRLGPRVPFIVVSPWVPKNTLIHDAPASVKPTPTSQMELSSIPATIHTMFNTNGFLTARDAWATPLSWIWENNNLTEPRTDCPMVLPEPGVDKFAHVRAAGAPSRPMTALHRELAVLMHAVAADVGVTQPLAAEQLKSTVDSMENEAAAARFMREHARRILEKSGVGYRPTVNV